MPPQISIVISTHNRCEELRRALDSCLQMVGVDYEVLVYDDASTDGTAEMVSREFPKVRFFRRDQRAGYIVLRNDGFHDSLGEYIVSIDDDAYFTESGTLSRIVDLFEMNRDVAAVALPFIEPFRHDRSGKMVPLPLGTHLRNYIGCAHAIRRDIALTCGGYAELLVHQGEERDLCIRLLEQGHRIIYGDTCPIVHCVSPSRSASRIHYYGYRNTILFSWMRVPFPYHFFRIVVDSLQLLRHKFSWRTSFLKLYYLMYSYFSCVWFYSARQPVSHRTYRLYRTLPRHGPLLEDIETPADPGIESRPPPDAGQGSSHQKKHRVVDQRENTSLKALSPRNTQFQN